MYSFGTEWLYNFFLSVIFLSLVGKKQAKTLHAKKCIFVAGKTEQDRKVLKTIFCFENIKFMIYIMLKKEIELVQYNQIPLC